MTKLYKNDAQIDQNTSFVPLATLYNNLVV